MTKITFITQTEERVEIEADSGTAMELAVDNQVVGIDGDCGGVCSCATCHVHVLPEQLSIVGEASDEEKYLLEFEEHFSEYSRLACQIEITPALDGVVLIVATSD